MGQLYTYLYIYIYILLLLLLYIYISHSTYTSIYIYVHMHIWVNYHISLTRNFFSAMGMIPRREITMGEVHGEAPLRAPNHWILKLIQ